MALMRSLLVANRGEIACRVIRTARRLNIRTIAIYSEADAGSAHVRAADDAVPIGPAAARDSYLNGDNVLDAAKASGAEAIHPGYGFLSENAEFADLVASAGLKWIGPSASTIRAMGRKDAAKRLMVEAGVPVTPGYLGDDQSDERLLNEAMSIGWPVLIKAVAGGGGRGMRRVERPEDFLESLAGARRESSASFGDDRVLLERYVSHPRHIEVQVFGDDLGQVVHLFERDCSLQRRHQKVIEEAPAPGMTPEVRKSICDAAIRAAQAVGYQGAGTVEFIADASEGLRSERIWFMEMNTRLQVEHPVTEAVTGVDLVEWQLRVACGEALPMKQEQIEISGHAMEARLYAEDPARDFMPSTGRLVHMNLPEDLRVDRGYEQGDVVSPYYDPMMAKLVVHSADRLSAAAALNAACRQVEVWPVKTNAAFLAKCAGHPDFVAGRVHTGFIVERIAELIGRPVPSITPSVIAALSPMEGAWSDPWSPRSKASRFRLNARHSPTGFVCVDGLGTLASFDIDLPSRVETIEGNVVAFASGDAFELSLSSIPEATESAVSDGGIRAPMPGRIAEVMRGVGDRVKSGQTILVLEAMKMEHALVAPFDGVIVDVLCDQGGQVVEGTVLARLTPTD